MFEKNYEIWYSGSISDFYLNCLLLHFLQGDQIGTIQNKYKILACHQQTEWKSTKCAYGMSKKIWTVWVKFQIMMKHVRSKKLFRTFTTSITCFIMLFEHLAKDKKQTSIWYAVIAIYSIQGIFDMSEINVFLYVL